MDNLINTIRTIIHEDHGAKFVARVVDENAGICSLIEFIFSLETPADRALHENPIESAKELVLDIYEKLSTSISSLEDQSLVHDLQVKYIIVGATLFDLTRIYQKQYPARLEKILNTLWRNAPWLANEIEAALDIFLAHCTSFRKEITELSSTQFLSSTQTVDQVYHALKWQLSIAESWYGLTKYCAPSTIVLVQDGRPLFDLSRVYDAVTRLYSRLSSSENSGSNDHNIKACLVLIKNLKWQWSGIAFSNCTALVNSVRGPGSDMDPAASPRQKPWYSVFMDILDNMEAAETILVPFSNAPLLLDLEFRYGIREILRDLSNSVNGSDDTAQVDYITISIDQLIEMADPIFQSGIHSVEQRIAEAQVPSPGEGMAHSPGQDWTSEADTEEVSEVADNEGTAEMLQIQEMMPGLGAGFIRMCLRYYNNNTEAVIGALLEDNLPPSLSALDRTMEKSISLHPAEQNEEPSSNLVDESDSEGPEPHPTEVISNRHNIFDNDEFDIFRHNTLDWSRVHRGKIEDPSSLQGATDGVKSRVMQIAKQMEDEDEYDDTYDETVQDVVVDTPDQDELSGRFDKRQSSRNNDKGDQSSSVSASQTPADSKDNSPDTIMKWESILVHQYTADASIFERTKAARTSKARIALRKQTGLADEQLEGWAIMLKRNPHHQRTLEKYEWRGEQAEIPNSANSRDNQKSKQGSSGDGHQRNERRTGENNKSKENGAQTEAQRKRKEKNKAKVANHQRKKQHDRKMRGAIVPSTN